MVEMRIQFVFCQRFLIFICVEHIKVSIQMTTAINMQSRAN